MVSLSHPWSELITLSMLLDVHPFYCSRCFCLRLVEIVSSFGNSVFSSYDYLYISYGVLFLDDEVPLSITFRPVCDISRFFVIFSEYKSC